MSEKLISADALLLKNRHTMETIYGSILNEIVEHIDIDDSNSINMASLRNYADAKEKYYYLCGQLKYAPSVDAVQVDSDNRLEYKGFTTVPLYSVQDKLFYGSIENIKDSVSYHTTESYEIEDRFKAAVEAYLFMRESMRENK